MSDFDEEAERERLREQYERDRAEREATEKMSELLLQGATMTNAHCSDCGDPIFRYEGQEFCATCEKAVDRGEKDDAADAGDAADGTTADEDGETTDDEHIEVAAPEERTRVQFGAAEDGQDGRKPVPEGPAADRASEAEPADGDQQHRPAAGEEAAADSDPDRPREADRAPRVGPGRRRDRTRTDRQVPEGADDRAPSGDMAAARGSLKRTLAGLTRRAEAAEDPAQAREYLAAAREAAETLAALRR